MVPSPQMDMSVLQKFPIFAVIYEGGVERNAFGFDFDTRLLHRRRKRTRSMLRGAAMKAVKAAHFCPSASLHSLKAPSDR